MPGCWSLASRSSDCTALLIALLVQAVIFQGVGRRCRFGGYFDVQLILAPLLAWNGLLSRVKKYFGRTHMINYLIYL